MTPVDFYFGPGSRYAYLAATQLPKLAIETGAVFRWRAVFSGDLVAATGGTPRSPQDPAYRLKDVERWARHYDVPFRDPEAEGVDWRRLAHACVAADRLGAAEAFATALYGEVFGKGVAPADDGALGRVAQAAGLEPDRLLATLAEPATQAAYDANLADALSAGAFGAPTFVTQDGELFWGQDRLALLRDHLRDLAAT